MSTPRHPPSSALPIRRFGQHPAGPASLPLADYHVRAYQRFFQPDTPPDQLQLTGLHALLREVLPIRAPDGPRALVYLHHELGDPLLSLEECRRLRLSYVRPLYLWLRLDAPEPIAEPVHVGDVPVLLGNGTFLIHGHERVVVGQIQRAPGIDFHVHQEDDRPLHTCRIMPQRGSLVQLRITRRQTLEAHVAPRIRMPAFTLIRAFDPALGSDAALLGRLGGVQTVAPETVTQPAILVGDVIDPRTGEVLAESGAESSSDHLRLIASKVRTLTILAGRPDPVLIESLREKQPRTHEAALLDLHRRLQRGHPPNLDRARQALHDKFRDPLRYQLGPVGRFRLRTKLGIDGTSMELSAEDLLAALGALLERRAGSRACDDADHLGNRRVRLLDELLAEQLRKGLFRFRRSVQERLQKDTARRPADLARHGAIAAALESFFARGERCQLVDQTNPLAQLTHERRLTVLGMGGSDRKRARFAGRDVHLSQHGRICPVETPEGEAIGLVSHLARYADIDAMGFLVAPLREVREGRLGESLTWLRADEEEGLVVASADVAHDGQRLTGSLVVARHRGEFERVEAEKVDRIGVGPAEMVGLSAGLIPFLEHDDANRALMGSNMQRQAVPLLIPEVPLVATGLEAEVARHSSLVVRAIESGVVRRVDAERIVIDEREHPLGKFAVLNGGTCQNQKPIVAVGDRVKAGQVIADGAATRNGELALGRNVLVAFACWEGYNFEDAIVVSERLVETQAFTSIHVDEYEAELRDNRLGEEAFTPHVPGVSPRALLHLDEEGLVRLGARVFPGDVLVGKVVPRARPESTPQERLLNSLLGRSPDRVGDSLHVPPGVEGVVIAVRRLDASEELGPGVRQRVRVRVACKRVLSVGDKMAGRHGNKGVVSKILPVEDMPYLADGTPVDILLNPLGVPSRMNVGQILETHLGWAAAKLGFKAITPVFDGASEQEIRQALEEAGLPATGKATLFDGRTGERFEQPVTVGTIYVLKLHHLVDDKVHARATGPYSSITQQPLGGKAREGGQRLGEMEVWALEAYGAANLLQEMLTVKSDDVEGRARTYEALLEGKEMPGPGTPASLEVLRQELRGLGLDLRQRRAADPGGT